MDINSFKNDKYKKNDKYDLAFKKNIKKNISQNKNENIKETQEFIMNDNLFPEINVNKKIIENVNENNDKKNLDFKFVVKKEIEHIKLDDRDYEYENLKPGWMLIKGDKNNYGKIITKFKPLNDLPKKEVNEMDIIAKILVDKWQKYREKYEEENGEGSYDEYYNEYYKNLPYDMPEYNFDDSEDDEDNEDEELNENNSYIDDYDEYNWK
jgi:hypothetical protein